jgi:hypothetical protein
VRACFCFMESSSIALRVAAAMRARSPFNQGLTLAHFSAQLERFLWDRGCA